MATEAVEAAEGGVLIRVRVQPKASRNAITMTPEGRLRIALTAPPVEGAANAALLRFLARHLGVKRQHVILRAGERSRDKTVFVSGVGAEAICDRLIGSAP